MLDREIGVREGLRLDALRRVDNENRALAGGERAADLIAEIDVAGRVDQVELIGCLLYTSYMEGYTAREIADKLYLSINTIKTHNKRIYMKLNVTSRKELMVYVQMMAREPGKEESRR